jgi:hypothetical protein
MPVECACTFDPRPALSPAFGGALPFLILSIFCRSVSWPRVVFFRKIASKLPPVLRRQRLLPLIGSSCRTSRNRRGWFRPFFERRLSPCIFFFAPDFLGNLLILAAILGIAASLYGTAGLRIKIRMLSYPYFLWLIIFTILPLFLIFIAAFFKKDAGGFYQFTTDGFTTLLVDRIVETKFYGITLHLQEYFSVFLRRALISPYGRQSGV